MTDRNLIVLYDGTWNDTDSDTNLKKLYNACSSKKQKFNYEEGVGTAKCEAQTGGIYGANIDRQILGGYRFLRQRFQDPDYEKSENKIFIFGFSRGSYASRRLAGLVDFCGLPVKAKDADIAWQLYVNQNTSAVQHLIDEGRLFKVPIETVCVWDTVKITTDKDFNDHKLPSCVIAGYHAMAIDEKRKFFPVLKWNSESRVRQVWFAGVHSDVGGGYSRHSLSDIALKWMIDCASKHGLRVKGSLVRKLLPLKPQGKIHESFKGIWLVLGKKSRSIGVNALVHTSVKERKAGVEYAPTNLPAAPNYVDL